MTREHGPRPGVTWQQEPVTVEVLVNDDGIPGTSVDGFNEPMPPRLNREQRRALERAQRRKGGKR